MNNPVICIRDASVENGSLMVKDMWPNRSQANPVVDPAPQGPRYLRQPENVLPVVANLAVSREVSGLAAYLLMTIDAGGLNANPSAAQAFTMATNLIARMRTGVKMDVNDVNGVLAGVVIGTGIAGAGASTATLGNILAILGGARFTVPAGQTVNATFLTGAQQEALFNEGVYAPILNEDSSFWISVAQGNLKGMKENRTLRGVTLDPLVVVYDVDGSVL
jgi:hypothetical protein